jgi:hypothetical protein
VCLEHGVAAAIPFAQESVILADNRQRYFRGLNKNRRDEDTVSARQGDKSARPFLFHATARVS